MNAGAVARRKRRDPTLVSGCFPPFRGPVSRALGGGGALARHPADLSFPRRPTIFRYLLAMIADGTLRV